MLAHHRDGPVFFRWNLLLVTTLHNIRDRQDEDHKIERRFTYRDNIATEDSHVRQVTSFGNQNDTNHEKYMESTENTKLITTIIAMTFPMLSFELPVTCSYPPK